MYSCKYRNTPDVHINADIILLTVIADTTEACLNMRIKLNRPNLASPSAPTYLQTLNFHGKK